MNKKILIPILTLIILWNTIIFSFNDSEHDATYCEELDVSLNARESEKIEELLAVYDHVSGENVYMTWEDYIICVLSAEMPVSYGLEALKAQAVAARTYTLYCIKGEKEKSNNADICTDYKHCQAFRSPEEVNEYFTPEEYSLIRKAVYDTKGEVLEYDGEIINAVYHASSYGKTESAKNVWGSHVPYLVSADSEGEDTMAGFESTVEISKDGFLEKLKMYGYPTDGFEQCTIVSYPNENNRVSHVEIAGKANELITIPATEIRKIFSLRSCSFTIREQDGNVVFLVKGYGHGVGMSQYGAHIMSAKGKNYKEILTHYYKGCKIEKRIF